jgi:hypothetical protein
MIPDRLPQNAIEQTPPAALASHPRTAPLLSSSTAAMKLLIVSLATMRPPIQTCNFTSSANAHDALPCGRVAD